MQQLSSTFVQHLLLESISSRFIRHEEFIGSGRSLLLIAALGSICGLSWGVLQYDVTNSRSRLCSPCSSNLVFRKVAGSQGDTETKKHHLFALVLHDCCLNYKLIVPGSIPVALLRELRSKQCAKSFVAECCFVNET